MTSETKQYHASGKIENGMVFIDESSSLLPEQKRSELDKAVKKSLEVIAASTLYQKSFYPFKASDFNYGSASEKGQKPVFHARLIVEKNNIELCVKSELSHWETENLRRAIRHNFNQSFLPSSGLEIKVYPLETSARPKIEFPYDINCEPRSP